MLEPFGEDGAISMLQLSLGTNFSKIDDKNVIPKIIVKNTKK